MKGNVDKLTADWKENDSVVLYGAGTVLKILEKFFIKFGIHIVCVIDKDKNKQGTMWNGVPILSFEDARNKIHSNKIVITAAHAAYNEISNFLEEQGYVQYKDFCESGQFICEWLWKAKQKNCIYHVDMTITTRCTLNCKHCNMFIPYHEKHFNYTFEELKNTIDLFFQRIDYVVYMGLLGGETLLHPALKDVIVYLEENYKNKYGQVFITTNGTLIPSTELLETLKKYNIFVSISDYTKAVPYQDKMNHLIKKFDEYNINYKHRTAIEWTDFGFPTHPLKRDQKQLKEHLSSCRPEWNGLNDGRFYYCNVSWGAEKSGKFKLLPTDFIDLKEIDPNDKKACHSIVELSRGTSSFCRICGGCGRDNTNFVLTGIQK